MTALELLAFMPPVATFADRVPGFLFGLPLVALASLVFAATHHEDTWLAIAQIAALIDHRLIHIEIAHTSGTSGASTRRCCTR